MICIELVPRYGTREISIDPSEDSRMSFEEYIPEYLENHPTSRFCRNVENIRVIEDEANNLCDRVVIRMEEKSGTNPIYWVGNHLKPISFLLSELYVIQVENGDEENQKADISRIKYPEREAKDVTFEISTHEGAAGARGYDAVKEIESDYGIELFWNWKKWKKMKVSSEI